MQQTLFAPAQLIKVIGLQQHVIEFQKAQILFSLQSLTDGFGLEHFIDGKMPSDVSEKINVVEILQPVIIMNEESSVFPLGVKKARNDGFNEFGVLADGLFVLQRTGFVFSRWVADFGGATAQQHDGLMIMLLKQP